MLQNQVIHRPQEVVHQGQLHHEAIHQAVQAILLQEVRVHPDHQVHLVHRELAVQVLPTQIILPVQVVVGKFLTLKSES
jgi:hypothetical protein